MNERRLPPTFRPRADRLGEAVKLKDDSFSQYLMEIGRFPRLSALDEINLAERRDSGDKQAFNRLVESNLKLVIPIARNYYGLTSPGLSLEDMVSEGNIGLLAFAEKFDPELGYRFSTGAMWWIRQAIVRAIYDKGSTIRIPVHIREPLFKIKSEIRKLEEKNGSNLSTFELRDMLIKQEDYSSSKIDNLLFIFGTNITNPFSLEQDRFRVNQANLENPFEVYTLEEEIPSDDDIPTQVEQEEDEILRSKLSENPNGILGDRNAGILKLRFGLGDPEDIPLSLAEVGREFGLSRERARQIVSDSLMRLRKNKRLREIWGRPIKKDNVSERGHDYSYVISALEDYTSKLPEYGLAKGNLRKLIDQAKKDKRSWEYLSPTERSMLDVVNTSSAAYSLTAKRLGMIYELSQGELTQQLCEALAKIWNSLRGSRMTKIPGTQALELLKRIESVRFLAKASLPNKDIAKILKTDPIAISRIKDGINKFLENPTRGVGSR